MQKNLHQIWLGTKPLPREFAIWQQTWSRHFPDWTLRLWTDEDLPALLPQMIDSTAFDHHLNVALRSDVLRLELLRLYGGIYMDTDFECLRNFEALLREGCFHYGDESALRPANSLLAAPRGHPFLEHMLSSIARHLKSVVPRGGPWSSVQQISGPDALHRALQTWVWLWHLDETICNESGEECGSRFRDIVCMRNVVWFPYHWDNKADWQAALADNKIAEKYPMAYAAHHWAGGWF